MQVSYYFCFLSLVCFSLAGRRHRPFLAQTTICSLFRSCVAPPSTRLILQMGHAPLAKGWQSCRYYTYNAIICVCSNKGYKGFCLADEIGRRVQLRPPIDRCWCNKQLLSRDSNFLIIQIFQSQDLSASIISGLSNYFLRYFQIVANASPPAVLFGFSQWSFQPCAPYVAWWYPVDIRSGEIQDFWMETDRGGSSSMIVSSTCRGE